MGIRRRKSQCLSTPSRTPAPSAPRRAPAGPSSRALQSGCVAVGVRGGDPEARLLQLLERAGEVDHPGDRAVLDRARGGLGHRAGHLHRAVLGDDHAVGAQRVGRADDGAQVVRVLDAVEHDDQRRVARGLRPRRAVLQLGVLRSSRSSATTPWCTPPSASGASRSRGDPLHPDARVARAASSSRRAPWRRAAPRRCRGARPRRACARSASSTGLTP